jgi:hypothetical protein
VGQPAFEQPLVIAAKIAIGSAQVHLIARTLMKNKHADCSGNQFTHRVIMPLAWIGKLVQPSEEIRKIVVNRFVNLSDDESSLGGLEVAGTGRC